MLFAGLRVTLMVNGLGLGSGLWSVLRLRLMVDGLGLGLRLLLLVWA